MSESLEDALESVSIEVNDLQEQYDKFLSDNKQREESGVVITQVRRAEGEDLLRRLTEARQRQTPLLLLSILQSTDRLEFATKTLQQSSESQLKVAQAQVGVTQSQARAVDDLLRSSHRLEQFTLFLLVIGAINVLIIEDTTGLLNGPIGYISLVGFVVAIVGLTLIAFRWNRLVRRNPDIHIP